MSLVADAFGTAFKSSKTVRFEPSDDLDATPPGDLQELDDMMIVVPPCHPYEPSKVPTDSGSPYYCLICGAPHAV